MRDGTKYGKIHGLKYRTRYGKGIGCLALTVLCLTAAPMQALAGSPEFAYSAETWAALRDNKLEYGEIADLIHEYNNTVIQNQIEYKDYKGKTQDDIAQDYYDAADDVTGSLSYPDSDDENYASGLSSYLNGRQQADTLREKGDDNVEDGEIKKLGYDQEEAELVKQAQELMITYWNQVWTIRTWSRRRSRRRSHTNPLLRNRRQEPRLRRGTVGKGGCGVGRSINSLCGVFPR